VLERLRPGLLLEDLLFDFRLEVIGFAGRPHLEIFDEWVLSAAQLRDCSVISIDFRLSLVELQKSVGFKNSLTCNPALKTVPVDEVVRQPWWEVRFLFEFYQFSLVPQNVGDAAECNYDLLVFLRLLSILSEPRIEILQPLVESLSCPTLLDKQQDPLMILKLARTLSLDATHLVCRQIVRVAVMHD
jgi:hypothetical protein